MPYIPGFERRMQLLVKMDPKNAGELNYILTMIANGYLKRKGESYQTYNDIMGAFEGAKTEMYRIKIAPYEDIKINENGDVYNIDV